MLAPLGLALLLAAMVCATALRAASGQPTPSGPQSAEPGAIGPRGVEALPAPDDAIICPTDAITLCIGTYTGTVRATFSLINPGGVSGVDEVHLVNFDQRIVGQSATAVDIEVSTRLWVDTQAPYPVDGYALPADIQPYLLPEPGWIQSDHPAIVSEAQGLATGTSLQAAAVDAIQAWVRGNIAYDYTFSLPNDALSVYLNRSGTCGGFSSLATAMLRAAGIPARYHVGCVSKWGWSTGDEGGWHAWVEIYYPDVGWVAADPQTTANHIDTSHIMGGFDQCGAPGTVITRTGHIDDAYLLDNLATKYTNSPWSWLRSASIPNWPRHSLSVSPSRLSLVVSVDDPVASQALWIHSGNCYYDGWAVLTDAPWLEPQAQIGLEDGLARFTVDAEGLGLGQYRTPVTVLGWPYPWYGYYVPSQTITADLWVVDTLYGIYVPLIGP